MPSLGGFWVVLPPALGPEDTGHTRQTQVPSVLASWATANQHGCPGQEMRSRTSGLGSWDLVVSGGKPYGHGCSDTELLDRSVGSTRDD
jgi:hypothetical protein